MRYSKQHKQATRQRILDSARQLFATRGFAATSIEAIMRACALTRGGFYAHFRSKSELYREALERIEVRTSDPSTLGFLASDVGSEDAEVRAAYTAAVNSLREDMRAKELPGGEEAILASAAMLVGALAIARTSADARLNEALLDACRRGAQTLLEHADELVQPTFFWTPAPRATTAA
jgi:TetR/AcrR family transcriptional regulator, transcriptional repressor for nem operon